MSVLSTTPAPILTATVTWPPLARDAMKDAKKLPPLAQAEVECDAIGREIALLSVQIKFLCAAPFLRDKTKGLARRCAELQKRRDDLTLYLSQSKKLSYDLDLCCFCYDANGACLAVISPATAAHHKKFEHIYANSQHPAFAHSGDNRTGVSPQKDGETLSVDLSLLAPSVAQVFFVIHSVNHCFDKIQGQASWSLLDQTHNSSFFAAPIRRDSPYKLYAMAKVMRDGAAWRVEKVDAYLPFAVNNKEIDQAVFTQLMKKHCPTAFA